MSRRVKMKGSRDFLAPREPVAPLDRQISQGGRDPNQGRFSPVKIQLLGHPRMQSPGYGPAPRGRKLWGLLSYLLCRQSPASREELASLLFSEADDPMGALRWNLAEIRRVLADPSSLHGRQVSFLLPPGSYVDVRVLLSGTWVEAVRVPGLGRELLEGFSFSGCPAFEAWLLNERRRLQAASEAVLREAALARLTERKQEAAIELAARLVALNPLDEAYQELLIRAYALAGDHHSANRQLAACIDLFQTELSIRPGPAVFSAAEQMAVDSAAHPIAGRPAALAQLEAGETAVRAGAWEQGVRCLRTAAVQAGACGDIVLKAKALSALGAAYIYAAKGREEEGAAALHEVILLSEQGEVPSLAVSAYRELAALEALRGRYERGKVLLERAKELADDDPAVQASLRVVLGSSLIETADYPEGIEHLAGSIQSLEKAGDLRSLASALAELGRGHLLLGNLWAARSHLERSCNLSRKLGMTSLLPYPESLLAEVELREGNVEAAEDAFEHAYALGCHLEDACYEGLAGRGLGLVAEAKGHPGRAVKLLDEARRRCARSSDASLWVLGYALDALCSVAIRHGIGHPEVWVNDLETLAGRTGMRELLVRAYLHRGELGDSAALDTAEILAGNITPPLFVGSSIRRRSEPNRLGR